MCTPNVQCLVYLECKCVFLRRKSVNVLEIFRLHLHLTLTSGSYWAVFLLHTVAFSNVRLASHNNFICDQTTQMLQCSVVLVEMQIGMRFRSFLRAYKNVCIF